MHRARDRSRSGGGAVSPAALVAAIALAANGALYDPSDLTSLYQSRTGGSTGASGSVVGIMLDKSYMGGQTAAAFIAGQAEIGPPTNTTTGWTPQNNATLSTVGGALRVTGDGVSIFPKASYTINVTIGVWYSITMPFADVSGSAGTRYLNINNGGEVTLRQTIATSGTLVGLVRATGSTLGIIPVADAANSVVDYGPISTKAIPGYHALAPSDAARPLLTVSGGLAYLTADGVDDWMNVTPTLNLGEAWWHVGGWRSDTANRRAFALTNSASGGVLRDNSGTQWSYPNNAAGNSLLAAGAPTSVAVMTLERISDAALASRYNGVAGTDIVPVDDSAYTNGLALFSRTNSAWQDGIAGRFYGGAFAPGALTSGNRAIVEAYVAALAGVTL